MKTLFRALLAFAVMLCTMHASAQPFSNLPDGSAERCRSFQWTFIDAPTTSTTGLVRDVVTTASLWVPGYVIPAVNTTTTYLKDCRTLSYRFTEASGSAARVTIQTTGTNQYGGAGTETISMTSSGLLYGKVAFAAYPQPVFTVISATSLSDADTYDISPWGIPLEVPPNYITDVISENIGAIGSTTYLSSVWDDYCGLNGFTGTALTPTLYNIEQGTWNPFTGANDATTLIPAISATNTVRFTIATRSRQNYGRGFPTTCNLSE